MPFDRSLFAPRAKKKRTKVAFRDNGCERALFFFPASKREREVNFDLEHYPNDPFALCEELRRRGFWKRGCVSAVSSRGVLLVSRCSLISKKESLNHAASSARKSAYVLMLSTADIFPRSFFLIGFFRRWKSETSEARHLS